MNSWDDQNFVAAIERQDASRTGFHPDGWTSRPIGHQSNLGAHSLASSLKITTVGH
jgi:hypothetical protein